MPLPGRVLYYDALSNSDKARPPRSEKAVPQLRIPLKNSFTLPLNKDDAALDDEVGVSPQRLYAALRGQFAASYLQQKLGLTPSTHAAEMVASNLLLRPSNCNAQVSAANFPSHVRGSSPPPLAVQCA